MLVLIKSLLFIFSTVTGLFLILKTEKALELQKKFYEKINPVRNLAISICIRDISNGVNWKIEPISKELELRNTKITGYILILIGIFSLFIPHL